MMPLDLLQTQKPQNFCLSFLLLCCCVWLLRDGFDLLLIDGGGGFDCENMKFVGYCCSCSGFDCEKVKFDSGFALVLFDMHYWFL